MSTRVLVFGVAGAAYGIDALQVREVLPHPPVTRVPNAPPGVRGVTNLRGRILPILDLRAQLAGRHCTDHPYLCAVVVEVDGATVGLVVDDASSIIDILPHQVRAPADPGDGANEGIIRGIADLDDRTLFLLDPSRIVTALAAQAGSAAP